MMRDWRGLYAITDSRFKGDDIAQQVLKAIRGGARIIQYRDKSNDAALRLQEATAIAETCKTNNVIFIVNDDIELAKTVNADGVHLGHTDASFEKARELLGDDVAIGVSCYADIDRAKAAQSLGASYVAFGRFFNSSTKPNAPAVSLDVLVEAKKQLNVPVVAIGGITQDNGAPLINSGADMLAVVNGVFGAPDITLAAQSICNLFDA
jgi:thiamine-phosphate pyrophosphorylase